MEEQQNVENVQSAAAAEEPKEEQKKEERKEEKQKEKGPSIFDKIKNKISEYRRVIAVASKPDKEEFTSSVKITAFGIMLIGLIGFVIYLIYTLIT